MNCTEIETGRLLLRQWRDEDVDPFVDICADPEVMQYIGDGRPRTRERTEQHVREFRRAWRDCGFGLYVIEETASGRMIGFSGFLVPDFLPEIMQAVEIAWRLARDCWGKGYATEASRAVLETAAPAFGLRRVVSICHVDNVASERVMQKIGMRFERETVVPDGGMPVRVYDIEIA